MKSFDFHLPTRIVYGKGRVKDIADHIAPSVERILIVSDHSVAEKSPAVQSVLNRLKGREVIRFLDVEENPSFRTVVRGMEIARENNIQMIIGIGGGSPMDAAKGVAVTATNPASLRQIVDGEPLAKDPLPVICVPTTSGTGSEVTPFAVFSDTDTENKCGFGHPGIFPKAAVIDPELTYTMPGPVVVSTGLDVLTHSLEAYLSDRAFPMNDRVALESIRIVIDNLKKAAAGDHDAMDAMAYASMLGGIAITHGSTILPHIMGYPLTVFHHMPHGLANAVIMPAFMNFMRAHSTVKDKVIILDGMFQVTGGIGGFIHDLGVSTRLSDYGVKIEEIEKFVPKVIVKGDVKITPAKITEKEIAEIYKAAL